MNQLLIIHRKTLFCLFVLNIHHGLATLALFRKKLFCSAFFLPDETFLVSTAFHSCELAAGSDGNTETPCCFFKDKCVFVKLLSPLK